MNLLYWNIRGIGFIAEDLESKALKDWYPIILITIYNLADLMGKSLTSFCVPQCIKRAICAAILSTFYSLSSLTKLVENRSANDGSYISSWIYQWISY